MGFYGTLKLIFYKVSIDQRPIDRGVGVSLVWMRLFHRGVLVAARAPPDDEAAQRLRAHAHARGRAAESCVSDLIDY